MVKHERKYDRCAICGSNFTLESENQICIQCAMKDSTPENICEGCAEKDARVKELERRVKELWKTAKGLEEYKEKFEAIKSIVEEKP